MSWQGDDDIRLEAQRLAARLPEPLAPLARLAFNYWWSWAPGGQAVFEAIDPHRWALARGNPVRLLEEVSPGALARAAEDPALVAQARALSARLEDELARRPASAALLERPVAFVCAEFGVHGSLPIYSGGLGALAGDILKEASDRALPLVGVGLMYRRGYFHQRVDLTGWQHEYWIETDPERVPAARVTGSGSKPLTVTVPVSGRDVVCQIWRADVGRVPLYLLDTEVAENAPIDRWITSRLYEGNRAIRLAQYAVLGIGGVRALEALGIEPGVIHMNEGHAALAALELASNKVAQGMPYEEALERSRQRIVFTTHTPVPAGNETYHASEILPVLGDLPTRLGIDPEVFLDLGRIHPGDHAEPAGVTVFAIRNSRSTNGVSRRHGEVARGMWAELYPGTPVEEVPITSVTNGAHLPTWMAPPMRALLDRYLGDGWTRRAGDPATWEAVEDIPDAELWAVRQELRAKLVDFVRSRSVTDRLQRGEQLDYVQGAAATFDPNQITIGFARRLATYKRLNILTHDPARALALLNHTPPVQLLFAGKAHPLDDGAKQILRSMFALKGTPEVTGRVTFIEDYDMTVAPFLVSGCDVWVNLPRPPLEASGTSGMKACFNGSLQLSVLDGWWAEAYDGTNGWAIDGEVDPDTASQDARHAGEFYRLMESEVVPLFAKRDADGVPTGWVAKIKASLRTNGPQFSASRMLADYERDIYKVH